MTSSGLTGIDMVLWRLAGISVSRMDTWTVQG